MYVDFSVTVVIVYENRTWRRYIRAAPRIPCVKLIQILHYKVNKYTFLLY